MPADLHGLAAVALVVCREFDAAVAVPVVVLVNERRHSQTASSALAKGRLG